MKMFLKEVHLEKIIIGMLDRHQLFRKVFPVHTGGSNSSRYCYSIWLRHLVKLNSAGTEFLPTSVAELGPGDSLGLGIAALLSGIQEYIALDIQKFWNPEQNIKMLDDLVALFEKNEPIPDEKEFPDISPKLDNYAFPASLLTRDRLKLSMTVKRIEAIRKELTNPDNADNVMIRYSIPWSDAGIIRGNSIELIISQAVLEHVDDLKLTYYAMKAWLKEGGLMSHTIDFKSHGFTRNWNGHWTLSEIEWKVVRGGRYMAINRQPFTSHIKLMNDFGFKIITKEFKRLPSKITLQQISRSFSGLSTDDLSVSGMYVVARK